MATLGFTRVDFEVFGVDGFNERMQQIYAHVRPKLLRLGDELAPALASRLHMEFFPHVAKHARRSVNPPPETWAAFGPSPKGYKRYGYLALCVSRASLHARAIVNSEADGRVQMADQIVAHADDLQKSWRGTRIGRYDDWDFGTLPEEVPANAELLTTLSTSLRKRTGGIDLGFGWPPTQASRLDRAELLDAFRELEPLY